MLSRHPRFGLSFFLSASFLLILARPLCAADQPKPMDNAAILLMLGYHVSPLEVVAAIGRNGSNTDFVLDANSYQALSDAGATEDVLRAMLKAMKIAAKPQRPIHPVIHSEAPLSPTVSQNSASVGGSAPAPGVEGPQTTLNGPALAPPPNPPSAPTPPPNTTTIPPVSNPTPSAPVMSVAESSIAAAKIPVRRAVTFVRRQPQGDSGAIYLDWEDGSATPDTVFTSGSHILRLTRANTILYTYQFNVKEIRGGGDDLSLFSDLISKTITILPQPAKTNAQAATDACTLSDTLPPAKSMLETINSKVQAMLPPRPDGGDYRSIPLSDSEKAWDEIRTVYLEFQNRRISAVQESLQNPNCVGDAELSRATDLVLVNFPAMRDLFEETDKRANSPWADFPSTLNRTSDYDITVAEYFQHAATQAKPKTYHLNHGFDVLTLSGGFLFTKLQARSYTNSVEPVPPPLGSPANTPPTSQDVLSVDGLGRGMRPALVALFNYHAPWSMGKFNSRDFGFAFSAGPVIEVANGKADTSRFGAFMGGSYHFWQRLFVTAGVHFGEFADFPQGFHAPGDLLPPNFGTPVPVKRWTGRFAFAVTFKGKDLSGLTPQGGTKIAEASPAPSNP